MTITDELLHVAVKLAGDDLDMLARIEAIVDGPPRPRPPIRYGTAQWHALPPHDPRREAAMRLAADCWADHCSPGQVAIDMAAQMGEVEVMLAQRVREASWDVAGARPWNHPSPSYADLQARRGKNA